MKRIGEDVAEKLTMCQASSQSGHAGANGPAQVRNHHTKHQWQPTSSTRHSTTGLLAQGAGGGTGPPTLYRQEAIFGRAGLAYSPIHAGAGVGICGVRLQPLVDALQS